MHQNVNQQSVLEHEYPFVNPTFDSPSMFPSCCGRPRILKQFLVITRIASIIFFVVFFRYFFFHFVSFRFFGFHQILLFSSSHSFGKIDETGKPKFSSTTNLAVSPEVSNKINNTRALFGGSAIALNKVNTLTPARNAASVSDLANHPSHHHTNNSNSNSNLSLNSIQSRHNHNVSPTPTNQKPVIKTPIKFEDELKVITQNNEPAKPRSFGYIFKNFFK